MNDFMHPISSFWFKINNIELTIGDYYIINKILVVYYSLFQSTKNLAIEITKYTDGTIRELIPENNYSFNYNTAAKEVRNQIERGYCPNLISGNNPIDDYEVIFIGSPNWFKSLAPPVLSFIRQHDFKGKKVVPFCTHGGGGFGQIEKEVKEECIDAIILPGFAINGVVTSTEIKNWLEDNRILKTF